MIKVSETQKPNDVFFVHSWERGRDPFHRDAFTAQFKEVGTGGERRAGWYGLDWCGNEVIFVPDGTELEPEPQLSVEIEVIGNVQN